MLLPAGTRPSLARVLGNHEPRIREQERRGLGIWHYVGEAGEPAFENGWGNMGGSDAPLAFRHTVGAGIEIQGSITGGTPGTTIFTLPASHMTGIKADLHKPAVSGDFTFRSFTIVAATGEVVDGGVYGIAVTDGVTTADAPVTLEFAGAIVESYSGVALVTIAPNPDVGDGAATVAAPALIEFVGATVEDISGVAVVTIAAAAGADVTDGATTVTEPPTIEFVGATVENISGVAVVTVAAVGADVMDGTTTVAAPAAIEFVGATVEDVSGVAVVTIDAVTSWQDFTPATTGITGETVNNARYRQIGSTVYVELDVQGTSNDTAKGFDLPIALRSGADVIAWIFAEDAGALLATPALVYLTGGDTGVSIYKDGAFSDWTPSGDWRVNAEFFYERA